MMITSIKGLHLGLALCLVTILSCTPTREQIENHNLREQNLPLGYTLCPEERKQFCTREYMATCGFKAKDVFQDYSNSCTACADPSVKAWSHGACEKEVL